MRLQGKTVLITAAAMGIGRASAIAMAREGAQVIATDVNLAALQEAMQGQANVECRKLDVLDDDAIRQLVETTPGINVLFNCAGWVHQGNIFDTSDHDWELSFNLNVRAQWQMIRHVLPGMLQRGGGSIINMASVCSSVKGFPNRFGYGASKAAVIGLTKSVAADFVRQGIRCNCICPGTIDTPSLADRINAFDDPVQARKDFIARQPMGRLGTAEEIAPIAVFLASDEASYATGQAFLIDGGILI